jgi:predicted PurR-regulated permease PerM
MAEPDDEQTTVYPSDDEQQPILIRMPVDVRNLALSVIAVLAAIAALRWAEPVLIPIVLAILLSYILNPAVRSLAKRRVPRALGSFIVIAALCGGIGYGAYTLSDEAVAIVDDLPRAAQKLRTRVDAKRSPQDATLLDRV